MTATALQLALPLPSESFPAAPALTPAQHAAELHRHGAIAVSGCITGDFWTESPAVPLRDFTGRANSYRGARNIYTAQQDITPGKTRHSDTVAAITSHFVDLDVYNVGLTQTEALAAAQELIQRAGLPLPRLTVDSGRGLYLSWVLHRPIRLSGQGIDEKKKNARIAAWSRLQKRLIAIFKPLGADPAASDLARVLRLSGTVNGKNGAPVRAWITGERLSTFKTLTTAVNCEYLSLNPVATPKRTAKPRQNATTPRHSHAAGNRIQNRYTLAAARMSDFRRLAELRGGRFNTGRNTVIQLYAREAAYYCRDRDSLVETVRGFVAGYIESTGRYNPDNTAALIASTLARAELAGFGVGRFDGDERYKSTTSAILEALDITQEEQRELVALVGGVEKNNRRTAKRRSAGIADRTAYNEKRKITAEERRNQVRGLRDNGMTIKEIAEFLCCSTGTVKRDLL